MKNGVLLVLVAGWLAACAPTVVTEPVDIDNLLSGRVLFDRVIDVRDIRTDRILALNDDMRAYVDEKTGDDPQARSRLRKLIQGMIDDGLLTLDYDPNLTHTAIETFRNRQGNCLSFSILFAALAREANLEVTFQMVDIPPSFRADGEMVLLNNHINVRVKGVRRDVNFAGDYVVDFNTAEYNGNYDSREVDDNYAIALYFSNSAVEAMQAGKPEKAFRYLKKGIETDSEIAGLWVNLGVLYSRNEKYDMAVDAYRQALSIEPSDKSALANLAGTLRHLGRVEEARHYEKQVTYYRDHNPYYHYYLAQSDYQDDRLGDAMAHLADAIRLKDDEHQFYFMRGLIYEKLQDYDLAASNYRKAREIAGKADLVYGYTRKLEALESRLR